MGSYAGMSRLPRFPTRSLEKRLNRPFLLSQAQRGLRFVRMQERGLAQATKRPFFHDAGLVEETVAYQTRP